MKQKTPTQTLVDGTEISSLIDEKEHSLAARIFTDDEIFQLELERIFAKTWVAVAHESEIPEKGDYVRRKIGLDPVIVSRDREGQLHVMLNACAHRGMQVCRDDNGNARYMRCTYHGWSYGIDGSFAGMPNEEEVYGARLDRERFALKQARVSLYGGWIFATWNEQAPEFDDYLGEHRWYMDILVNRSEKGLEVLAPPQRFFIDANWKFIVENFSADHGHIATTHKSLGEIGLFPTEVISEPGSITVNCGGHSVLMNPGGGHGNNPSDPLDGLRIFPPAGMPLEMVDDLPNHLSEEQLWVLANSYPTTGIVFPGIAWVVISPFPYGDQLSSVYTMRLFFPVSADRTEVLSFSLAEKDASDDFKRMVLKATTSVFGATGIFEGDDIENWTGMQRGLKGVINSDRKHVYPAVREPDNRNWNGPGEVHQGAWCDSVQWNMYKKYFELMKGSSS